MFSFEVLSSKWKLCIVVVVIIIAYIQFLINHSNKLYFWLNRKHHKFFNRTVSWSCKYTLFTKNMKTINDFQKTKKEFENRLKKDRNTNDYRILINDDRTLQIELSYRGRLRVLQILFFTGDKSHITFSYSSSLSYQDTIQEFEAFDFLLNQLKEIVVLDLSETAKNLYEIEMFLEKWNPFYETIRFHMINETTESYQLKIRNIDEEGSLTKIDVKKKSLKITSENSIYIKKAVKNYLVLSNTY